VALFTPLHRSWYIRSARRHHVCLPLLMHWHSVINPVFPLSDLLKKRSSIHSYLLRPPSRKILLRNIKRHTISLLGRTLTMLKKVRLKQLQLKIGDRDGNHTMVALYVTCRSVTASHCGWGLVSRAGRMMLWRRR
jgi:hypothetical protein